jgi:hypothetical protein
LDAAEEALEPCSDSDLEPDLDLDPAFSLLPERDLDRLECCEAFPEEPDLPDLTLPERDLDLRDCLLPSDLTDSFSSSLSLFLLSTGLDGASSITN